MNAHECLLHPWLTGDHSGRTKPISANNLISFRDHLREKYAAWNKYLLPIGRLAEYSSLRKLLIEKYKIIDATIGALKKALYCIVAIDVLHVMSWIV